MVDAAPRRILDAGDAAFVVEFGQTIDPSLVADVTALDRQLRELIEAGGLAGLLETVPTFRSLTIIFDPLITTPGELLAEIDAASEPCHEPSAADPYHREWVLPVHYGGERGPDLDSVADRTSLTTDEVAEHHQAGAYRAYMLGFQPGFAFLGDLPEPLHLPRREQPRTRVPCGSVAIANQLTAVYPWQSPGGWHLIGYCPVPLFDATWPTPTLLEAGDMIRFSAVDQATLDSIERSIHAGEFDIDSLRSR